MKTPSTKIGNSTKTIKPLGKKVTTSIGTSTAMIKNKAKMTAGPQGGLLKGK